MKYILTILLLSASVSYGGGDAIGTMSIGGNGTLNTNPYTYTNPFPKFKLPGSEAIFYKGESIGDVLINYGKLQGNTWKVQEFKIDKQMPNLNQEIINAITQSKSSKNWVPFVPGVNLGLD
jgi:hypothetical protein